MTPSQRKLNSEKTLASLGIVLIDSLPPIEAEYDVTLKTAQQIAKRVLVLAYLNCVAADPSLQQEIMMFLIREKLWDEASVKEQALFHKPNLSEDEASEIQSRTESIWLMLWAINKVSTLDLPAKQVDHEDIFGALPGFFEITNDFIETAETRGRSEILDQADFIFRLNWAIREASIRKETIPNINELVAYERHLSLNWITGLTDRWQD